MDNNQAKALLQRYQAGDCTLPEKQLVEQWYNQLIETGEWNWGEGEKMDLEQIMEARLLQRINHFGEPRVHHIHSFRQARWWAAASVILLLGAGSFLFFNRTVKPTEIVKAVLSNDTKAPETNKAMITLANGQKVYLDSAVNGTLAMQGNVKLVKLANGQIAYQTASGEAINEIKYNTLENPRGSKVIDITLADGSEVWLNASSSVTYPVAFVGNERKVAITGEAYFEVTHNAAMPFKVSKGGMEVSVLGTHFNVNAYDDESDIKVTLLEGSVKVIKGTASSLLKQGQQAQVTNEVKLVNGADLELVMAWKNGFFKMKGTDLAALMRQVARWYDVQVSYERPLPQKSFGGSINRDVNLSDVLNALEQYGIRSRMEKGKVIIQ